MEVVLMLGFLGINLVLSIGLSSIEKSLDDIAEELDRIVNRKKRG